jgi:uncharacterized protein YceH (UPF0502 family)
LIGYGPASMYGASINQEGGNMFGKNEDENKNKIEQLEEKVEKLENEIASIKDYIDMQDGYSDDFPSAFDSVN